MKTLRNRWVYAFLAAFIAGSITLMFYLSFLKHFQFTSLLVWSGYAMTCAAIAASLLWPRNNKPTFKRMTLTGIAIPIIVITILSLTFSILNPGFPDAMREGFETNISHVLSGGLVMFVVFSLSTYGTPYLLGVFLSFMFVEPKEV